MNKATRILVMTGMALVAGATVGAGPASAATATPSTTTKAAAKTDWGHDRIVGYFRSPSACRTAGYIGERRGKWDNSDCIRVRGGFRRGLWALSVSEDRHNFPGHSFPGHNFPGQGGPGHGGPGNGGPGNGGPGNGGPGNGPGHF
jgi:hypothetical protein